MDLKPQLRFASSPLPKFSDQIETEFFLVGFYPWTLKYGETTFKEFKKSIRIEFDIEVILKKQIRKLLKQDRYKLDVTALYDKSSTRVKFKEIKLSDED